MHLQKPLPGVNLVRNMNKDEFFVTLVARNGKPTWQTVGVYTRMASAKLAFKRFVAFIQKAEFKKEQIFLPSKKNKFEYVSSTIYFVVNEFKKVRIVITGTNGQNLWQSYQEYSRLAHAHEGFEALEYFLSQPTIPTHNGKWKFK